MHDHVDEDVQYVTSFETDPDPTETMYCIKPHYPSERLVQYALMRDAGSTGSRIHVYKCYNCGPSPAYEHEVFKMSEPGQGLSSFAGHPTEAAVKATGGLCLLPRSQSADIVDDILHQGKTPLIASSNTPLSLYSTPAPPAPASTSTSLTIAARRLRTYQYEVCKMTKLGQGLSSIAGLPTEAPASLDVLLDEAMRVVPISLRKCTPVAVRVTAGIRLLPGSQSAEILDAVAAHLRAARGRLRMVHRELPPRRAPDSPANSETFAVLDLGGASTQIVFAALERRCTRASPSTSSTMAGRRACVSVYRIVDFMATLYEVPPSAANTASNPCLARGTQRTAELVADAGM
ncbi:hypothetical protein DFH06DRAFT_1340950 [Mycena polygramma]|nr:hypothetical protein DFH06DRAFT_1340950 [Mycena polygramma]